MTIKLAVLGHYDSRGGTLAIPIPEFTVEAVKAAMAKYDEQLDWDIERDRRDYDRDPTHWGWNPHDSDPRPSHDDFLLVAELFGEQPTSEDLQDAGQVWLDSTTEPDAFLPDLNTGLFDDDTWAKVTKHMAEPVKLEYVPVKYNYDLDEDENTRIARAQLKVLEFPTAEYRDWHDDAFGFVIHKDKR